MALWELGSFITAGSRHHPGRRKECVFIISRQNMEQEQFCIMALLQHSSLWLEARTGPSFPEGIGGHTGALHPDATQLQFLTGFDFQDQKLKKKKEIEKEIEKEISLQHCRLFFKTVVTANITMETPKNKDFPSLVRAHLQGQDRQLAFCLSKANLLHSWCHLRTFFYHRTGAFCCTHDKLSEKEPGGYERKLPWNYAGLLKRKRKGEAVPGTFILLILLTHTSLHSADVLLKDIQDSSSYSSAYCY